MLSSEEVAKYREILGGYPLSAFRVKDLDVLWHIMRGDLVSEEDIRAILQTMEGNAQFLEEFRRMIYGDPPSGPRRIE